MIAKIILIVLPIIGLGVHMSRHGEVKTESKFNGWHQLFRMMIIYMLFYYSGLFDNFNL